VNLLNERFVREKQQQDVNSEIGEWLAALNRYCQSITNSKWDAEDLVQETCLRAIPILTGLQGHANPTALLLRMAKNLSIDQFRRKQLAKGILDRGEVISHQQEDSSGIEYVINMLVQHLSPLQCSVFLLRELYGYKGTEIAAALKTSKGAVKAALFRARTAIDQIKAAMLRDDRLGDRESGTDESLLLAYITAVRQSNPHALVLLALSQSELIDPVQAIGRAIQITNLPNKKRIHASQSTTLLAAA
jgi:RNA polymerase sigma factor (sigma-70 family)